MSGDLDTRLFDLADAIGHELELDATIDFHALGRRFDVPPSDVERVVAALRAVQQALGEDLDARPRLAPPELPDDYELGPELGRGGMGVVYRAHQRSLDRDVAVKVLRPGDLAFGPAIARFEREAKNLARLRHRHIVTVHEVGRANGHVYFTMDLVDGKSLQRAITDREMTAVRAVKLVRQICSAMVYAHQKGVVHRDLKPANVLVDQNDDAFVCDFGLARDLDAANDATLSGQLVGTPAYMSPEQALGDKERTGEASDVYAIGAILYECLSGVPPFHGLPLAKLMHAVVADEPEPLRKRNPRVPQDLAVICGKAMQKRIEDRYATVQALAEDLERFAIGKEILARPLAWPLRVLRSARRHRVAVTAAALPVVAAVAAMWWFVVPELLQRHQRELGDRLFAEGNRDGARYAYAEAGLSLPQFARDPDARCTRYADCLVDEAGRLLAAGEPDRARELANAAKALVPDNDQLRHFGALDAAQMIARQDAWYVSQKVVAVLDERTDLLFGLDELMPRLRANLEGSRPEAAALLAAKAAAGPDNVLAPLDTARAPWITTLLRMRTNLPPAKKTSIDLLCRSRSQMDLDYRDAAFEAALVAIVRDRSVDVEARKDAAALFDSFGSFPFVREHVRQDHANGFAFLAVVRDEDLDALVTHWDGLSGMDRATAHDRCIGIVVETLSKPAPGGTAADVSHLQNWLQCRTGSRPRQDEDATVWWETLRTTDPRARLLTALKWDLRPDDLTPDRLLQEFRSGTARRSAFAQLWIHGLLALTVPADVRVPFVGLTYPNLTARWERALGAIPGERYTLRIATLGFLDGAPTPHILWQHEVPIVIDQTVRWNERTAPDLGGLDYSLAFRHGNTVTPMPQLVAVGQARLTWTQDGVRGRIDGDQTLLMLGGAAGQYRGDHDLLPGMCTIVEGGWVADQDGQWHIDRIQLAYLAPPSSTTAAWTASDWQDALGATVATIAAGSETTVWNTLPIATAADFLPLGTQRAALATIDQKAQANPFGIGFDCAEERRRARLFAGDTEALSVPTTPAFAEDPNSPAPPGRTSFLIRLALATDVPALRDHAFEQVRGIDLPPAFARTLAAATVAGTPAPAWLVDRVRDTPSRFAAFVQANYGKFLWLLLLVLGSAALLVATLRSRSRVTATVLFVAGIGLSRYTLVLADTEFLPPWPGYGLTVVAAWVGYWRVVRSLTWWLAPAWWTATAVLLAFGGLSRGDESALLTVAVVLHVGIKLQQWRAHRKGLQAGWDRQRRGLPRLDP